MRIVNLGEIGAVGGVLRPIELTLERNDAVWNLTDYDAAELRVWDLRTKTLVAINGTTAIVSPNSAGVVRYTPGTDDPIHALGADTYEARVWVSPSAGGDPEPSGLFRFTIGAGPGPS